MLIRSSSQTFNGLVTQKPGLFLQAAKDFNIDLSQSYMIGDKSTDIEAGQNAGCKESYLIGTNEAYSLLEWFNTRLI